VTIRVVKSGLQTTIQGQPRIGQRHLGVPASGPADPLSMALANRLVGNSAFVPALETTLTGMSLRFACDAFIAIAGASAACTLNSSRVAQHITIAVQKDDLLVIGAATHGVRSYIAFAGGLCAQQVLGSGSTYLPAAFGGHDGRALMDGDELRLKDPAASAALLETPPEFCLPMRDTWSVRAGYSVETINVEQPERLFSSKFKIGNRSDRMGIELEGETFVTKSSGQMPSVPVFPGVIQCPQDGSLFILSIDSGTTGGYPRVAKIARLDLHILGQLRPGNSLTLLERSDEQAAQELREKHAYWQPWLPDISQGPIL